MNVLEKAIAAVCQVLLWISSAVIFAILAVNTILRYATGASLQWANEVPELLFPWLVMAGVVLAAQHGAHITTSFLVDKLAHGPRKVLSVGGWLTVAALYATLAWATWGMLDIVHDEKSPILGVPGSVTYACVLVGMAMLAVQALVSVVRAWTQTDVATAPAVPEAHW